MKRIFIVSLILLSVFILSRNLNAQIITTYAGTITGGYNLDGVIATSAQINNPYQIVMGPNNTLYIADCLNNRIRRVNSAGIITTIAGTGAAGFSGDGGLAVNATMNYPVGVAVDAAGNVYFTDRLNYRVRKINTSGIISTIAGLGFNSYSGDGGAATSAAVSLLGGMCCEPNGILYIVDQGNYRIRKINLAGTISTIAGTGAAGFSGDGGAATSAMINFALGITIDNANNLYLADCYNHRIRRINNAGIITTIAGNGVQGFAGDGGLATSAALNQPGGATIDLAGNLYIADFTNHRIRKVNQAGIISTYAGIGSIGFSGDGGPAINAQFYYPFICTFDTTGNLYLCDRQNSRVRKISCIQPTISASPSSATICGAQPVSFTATGATSYTWYPGGNTGSTVALTPSATTIYTVKGMNASGCSALTQVSVMVSNTPTVTVNSGSICLGNSFTISPSGAVNYTIEGGSAIVSPTANTSYTIAGTSPGCPSTGTAIANVTVNALPLPTISVNSGTICSGQSFTMTPSGANTYTFQGGSAVVNPTANTNYTVVGTNTAGCVSAGSASASVFVNTTPTITVNSGSICSGNSFTMIPNGAVSYTFQGGNAVVSPTSNANYTVIGTGTNGCVSQGFATSNITVAPTPTVNVNNGVICSGATFTMFPFGAFTYTIQGGSAVVSPTASTSYTVIGTSSAGCVSNNVATSNVTVIPSPTITVNSGSICSGNSFTINPSGALTYTIQGGGAVKSPIVSSNYTVIGATGSCTSNIVTSSITVHQTPTVSVNSGTICQGTSFLIVPSGANTYTIQGGVALVSPTLNSTYTVIGSSTAGCVSNGVATSTVIVFPAPSLTIAATMPTICVGQAASIGASGALSYTWQPGNINNFFINISPTITTVYTVSGTGANGCVGSTSYTQNVTICEGMEQLSNNDSKIKIFPNPFTNQFTVVSKNNELIQIFNSTGSLIYYSKIENEKIEIDMDGNSSGIYFLKIGSTVKKIIKE